MPDIQEGQVQGEDEEGGKGEMIRGGIQKGGCEQAHGKGLTVEGTQERYCKHGSEKACLTDISLSVQPWRKEGER